MNIPSFALLLAAIVQLPTPAVAEEMTFTSAHGGRVAVIADFPAGRGPHPAVLLAPGSGYHMRLPALVDTSRALVRDGVAVFRFNWAYFSTEPKGKPSDDLAREVQDMEAVLAAARSDSRVDSRRIGVGGKSLGSIVSWRVFVGDPRISSALLLTPVCSQINKADGKPRAEATDNYPMFATETRPTLWLLGDKDPLCAPHVLYAFVAKGAGRNRVAVVGGDHSFEDKGLPATSSAAARARNVSAVATVAAAFVVELLQSAPSAP